ncbi:MAG TPA: transcriptional repressor LexA [Phycisphaerae bacterium]|nr:transcriptional repressor LexA [Phycisphaerae bacterium]HUU22317.1 transcriptional repressor LexA [Phycisphaerae bacterium]
MRPVTPRQMDILRFLRDYRDKHGYSPTMQEMADCFGLTKVTVFEHVGALERKGLLRREAKHRARCLQISPEVVFPEDEVAATRIHLAGRIAAGYPLEAVENPETLDLKDVFARSRGTFCLKVTGDSMIDEHIRDGDYVICEQRTDARNGETVVALLEDGEATLKKFYREKGRIRLQPANPSFAPIYVNDARIQGVVIGVLRTL